MSFVERQTMTGTDRGPNRGGSFCAYRTHTVWHQHVSHPLPCCSLWSVICPFTFSFTVGSLLNTTATANTNMLSFLKQNAVHPYCSLGKEFGKPQQNAIRWQLLFCGAQIHFTVFLTLTPTHFQCLRTIFTVYTYARNFHYEKILGPSFTLLESS